MNYKILAGSSNTTQSYSYEEKVNTINKDCVNTKNYIHKISYQSNSYNLIWEKAINLINTHSYSYEREKLLFMSFINQRKLHRYYKAIIDCNNEEISEDELEKIEDSCVLSVNKDNEFSISAKLLYFYDLMAKYAPEEIEYINNEDLADLLSISEYKINKLHHKINNDS